MDGVLDNLNNSTLPAINSSITNYISTSCAETLKSIKSITSQYLRTNKPAPTEFSYFIPNIFKPFLSFVEQIKDWTDTDTQLEWAQIVAKDVITQYFESITELSNNLNLTDEKLRNKRKVGELSDEDKIRLQLFLDVQQLGREVSNYI